MKARKHICFVSPTSLPLFLEQENTEKYIGGAEVQQKKIALSLKQSGYDVSFILYDGENIKRNYQGIKLIPCYNKNDELNVIKKILFLWGAMKRANADIYYRRSGNPALLLFPFCKINKKFLINSIPSDTIVKMKYYESSIFRNLIALIINNLEIFFSDVLITQNIFQKEKIEKKFHKKSVLIKSMPPHVSISRSKIEGKYFLWVGTLRKIKNPQHIIELATQLKKFKFMVIGGRSEEPFYYDQMKKASEKLDNLIFKGHIEYNEVQNYYESAIALLNTSDSEGFSNTFLEAWSYGVPVISLYVDPGDVIKTNQLGLVSKTFDKFKEDVKRIGKDTELREIIKTNAFTYLKKEHNTETIIHQYKEVIESLC